MTEGAVAEVRSATSPGKAWWAARKMGQKRKGNDQRIGKMQEDQHA